MNPAYILYAVPFFLLFIGIEALYSYLKKKGYYRFNDSIVNLCLGIGNQVFNLFIKIVLFGFAAWLQQHYSIWKIPFTWWSFTLCLFLFDFCFYWAHRWGHEVNIFWGAHVVHHQSEEYNLSVALRQSWFHNILAFFIFLPIPLLGFDAATFGAAAGIDTLYQFWIHTRAIGKLPRWIEWFFNTPSHHRVHHAINPKYIDKNHGGMFIIWDRLFGTFKAEDQQNEIVYGITTQLKSWNPVWANWHYYHEIISKALRTRSWKNRLRFIVAKPGWQPEELGGVIAVQEPDRNLPRYDASNNVYLNFYVLVQFVVLLGASVYYIYRFREIQTFYQVAFFLLIIVSMLIISAILEKRPWVYVAELVRLVIASVVLNSFYYSYYHAWFHFMLAVSIISVALFYAYLFAVRFLTNTFVFVRHGSR